MLQVKQALVPAPQNLGVTARIIKMVLKELQSSLATMGACMLIVYLAIGFVRSYSSEAEANVRIALSSDAAHYIYLRR